MSKLEFDKIEDCLQFLMQELPDRSGKYYYRRRSIVYKEDIIIEFQYDGMIVVSAVLIGQLSKGKIENGIEYRGFYQFAPNSFVECKKPVNTLDIKAIMPEFKGYNQSTQFLSKECICLVR